MVINWISSC